MVINGIAQAAATITIKTILIIDLPIVIENGYGVPGCTNA